MNRRLLFQLLATLLVCIAAVSQSSSQTSTSDSEDYSGRKIARIEIQGPSAVDPKQALATLKVHEGEPLDRNHLRESIQALYNTGFYSDIQVEAEPAPGTVTLIFHTKENYFVGTIWIEGAPKSPPTHVQIVNAAKLQLGELVTPQKLAAAVDGIARLLSQSGYHQAVVTVREGKHPETQQDELTFAIKAGKRAHVGKVQVTGDPGYSAAELAEIAELEPGDRVGLEHTRRALARVVKKYESHDYLEAQVQATGHTFQPETNTEDYVLNVQRGPKVLVEIRGARLRRGLVKRYVPIFQEHAVDPDLLREGARNIADYFQSKGYFDAQVEPQEQQDTAQNLTRITFVINKGIKHKLESIEIDGNTFFSDSDLREHMQIEPSSLFQIHGRFSQSLLARDIQTIQDLYHANGFQQASVQSKILDDYRGVKGHLKLILTVNEGQQTLVSSLAIQGNKSVSTEKLLTMIGSTAGQPFSDETLAIDRESVLGYYVNQGFPSVQFEATAKATSQNPPRMAVTYNITEGLQVFVRQVLISGLHFTRPYVVDREMMLGPGDPLSQTAMFDSQRRLYDVGLFNEVDTGIQNPDGVAPEKNVLFQTEEAKRYTFTYGIGLEAQTGNAPGGSLQPQGRTGLSPRVSFDVTRINFRGRDHTIQFKGRYGRLQQEALVSYQAPHWFGRENMQFIVTSFYDLTRDVRTFTAERLEGSAQIEHKVTRPTTLLYGFLYRRVKVDPRTLAIDPNQIPLLSRPVRVGMPTFTWIRDERDDPLDTHKGSYNTLDTGVSAGFFGSEASFSRYLYTNSTYHEFRKKKWVLARNTRIGVENTFGSSTFVPLPERFFAGGANSLRGFGLNQAGPRDGVTGFPVGGQALLLNQLELRFPAPTLPLVGDSISPVLFHDAGNVFASPDDMFSSIFRVKPHTCTPTVANATCDFNYFNHALGLGLRYRTPIGPIRFDLGYSLNPTTFPVLDDPAKPVQTLRRFNFYFSVGQSF